MREYGEPRDLSEYFLKDNNIVLKIFWCDKTLKSNTDAAETVLQVADLLVR